MPITYQIDPQKHWLEVKVSGRVTVQESTDSLRALFADPHYNDDLCGIVDCREMTDLLNISELRGVADMHVARPTTPWRSRRAIIVASPEHYTASRLFTLFAESGPIEYGVFYNRETAMQWVKE
jgi:hypothetical protein